MSPAAQQRAAIRRLTAMLAVKPAADAVQQAVVEEACRLTQAAGAALCLLRQDSTELDYVAAAGEYSDQIVGMRVKLADSIAETVVAENRSLLLDSHEHSAEGSLFEKDDFTRTTTSSSNGNPFISRFTAIAPVHIHDKTVGVLAALSPLDVNVTSFQAEDLEILEMLADFAGLAISEDRDHSAAREQARELSILYDSTRAASGALNVQEALNSSMEALCNHLENHAAAIFLLNDERTHLYIAADRGLNDSEREVQISVENPLAARILHQKQPLLIPNTENEPDFVQITESVPALSAMFAPVRSREETHGIILVTSLQRNAYHEEDLPLPAAVGMQAGIAIESAWLYEDASRQAEQTGALYELSQHLNATLQHERIFGYVADCVTALLNTDRFALMLYDKVQERLLPKLLRNLDKELFCPVPPRPGEGIGGWVFEWQTPQAVADVAADPRNRKSPIDSAGVASTLCVPMHVGEEVIGVIHALSSKRRLFTVVEMELLYTIANQAAVAIYNTSLYHEVRARAQETRRYFRRMAQAIGSAFDEQDLPRRMADLSMEIMRADRCAIYRIDPEGLQLLAASHFRSSIQPDSLIPVGQGLAGWVARRGFSLALPALEDDSRSSFHAWLNKDRLSSYLGVPIKLDQRTVGVIEVYTQELRTYTPEEARLLASFVRRSRLAEKFTAVSEAATVYG